MTRPLQHWLLLASLVVMWGSAFMLNAIAVRGFEPSVLVAVRLVVAGALLGALLAVRRHGLPRERRFWVFALLLALAGNCIPFWLISFGLTVVPSGVTGVLMGIMPLTTMVLAHLFVEGERLNGIKAAGFGLGFLGLVVLVGPEALLQLEGQGTALVHLLAILGGAICYAIHAILARLRPKADPITAAAGVMLVGAVIMAPLGLPAAPAQLAAADPGPLLALAVLSVVATAIATVVFLTLVSRAGPSFTSFINYLIPLWALLIGAVFMAERPGPSVFLALALILGGIALSEIGARRARIGTAAPVVTNAAGQPR